MTTKTILDLFTSLKLTVVTLACAMVLVFSGTLAQVELGLWQVQTRFFGSFIVWWPLGGSGFGIPIFPGGYTVGGVLLINLVAVHLRRFKYTWAKTGLLLAHFGLILLLLGQLTTGLLQEESAMSIEEGQSKNYSEVHRKDELAVIEKGDPQQDRVVAIPASMLNHQQSISPPQLPFSLRVIRYLPNSTVSSRPFARAAPVQVTESGADPVFLREEARTYRMDRKDMPSAFVEVVLRTGQSLGTRFLSTWQAKPQSLVVEGKPYEISLRPARRYLPYTLTLLDFRFDRYPGTNIPKNYSSEIRLQNPQSDEDRQVLIYMNNPLRYAGKTFYQSGFDPRTERGTILQVVRNPSWLMPYVSCSLITLGLLLHFALHLARFLRRARS